MSRVESATRSSRSAFGGSRRFAFELLAPLGKGLFIRLLQLVVVPGDGRASAQLLEVLLRFAATLFLGNPVADVLMRLLEGLHFRLGARFEREELIAALCPNHL